VRALVACGYTTQRWTEVPPVGRRLVEALSRVLPEYRLPRAALGHTRHYMPTTKLDNKGRDATTLVLDTFADVGSGELWVRWPVEVDDEASALFEVLVTNLGYLGRSESWVLASTVDDREALPDDGVRSFPHEEGGVRPGRGYEQLTLVAPEPADLYDAWRSREVESATTAVVPPGKRLTAPQKKKIAAIEDLYPVDILDCLERDTAWWKARKWSQAPGSRAVLYWRESNALEVAPTASPRAAQTPSFSTVLLALTTPSGSMSALPSVARTLPQADLLHKALVSKLRGKDCPELSGRDTWTGKRLEGHRHAHIVPLDLDDDGRLDHVIVHASMGLGAVAQDAIRSARKTYMKGGVGELQLAIAGLGELVQLRDLPAPFGPNLARLLDASRTWESATPFVPPRHLKKRGRNTLEGQVAAELESRELPEPEAVEVLEWDESPRVLAMRHFVRRRRGNAPQPPIDVGFALRLSFAEPVAGPLLIGYGSHFGLGQFRALGPT